MRSTLLNQGAFAKVRASTTTRSSLLLIVALFFCSSLVENCKAFQAPPLLAINNKNSILQVQPQGIPTQPVSSLKISRGDEESINPNDLETPEERKRRMEMVRQVQKSFYGQVNVRGERHMSVKSEKTSTVLKNVPLWRVQWTELPGYQNILNCHVAHYTRKFCNLFVWIVCIA